MSEKEKIEIPADEDTELDKVLKQIAVLKKENAMLQLKEVQRENEHLKEINKSNDEPPKKVEAEDVESEIINNLWE